MAHWNRILTLLFLLSSFALSSCESYVADAILPERPNKEFHVDPDSSNDFKLGFKDGCEVGMSGATNTFYKIFYRSNKIDGYKMASSGDYKNAWGIGYWWCYRKDYIKMKSSIWGSTFGGIK